MAEINFFQPAVIYFLKPLFFFTWTHLELFLCLTFSLDPIRKCRKPKDGVFAAENCILDSQYNGLVQLPEDRKNKTVRLYSPKLAAASKGLVKSKGFFNWTPQGPQIYLKSVKSANFQIPKGSLHLFPF